MISTGRERKPADIGQPRQHRPGWPTRHSRFAGCLVHLLDLAQPPPPGAAASDRSAPSGSSRSATGFWTRSASPRSSRNAAWTSWQPTGWATPFFTAFEARPHRERNFARFVFLDETARSLYADWEKARPEERR
ncbi:hypothetical protein QFZ22_003295 [Streptomyces canus]|uniref:MmyB-like transcription regulator ligand binding domain-containing protein n=1 Tax=Streptomyces canus TaxID=58343 RepID=A0AAW8FDR7_9ACTN|nr:hypothetical protein [Streptomyces canus]MDQ0907310.1 hypothetical protein [Streptomyces canus]